MTADPKNHLVPLNELEFSFSHSSGPGGQNVNKLNTKATLFWKVSKNKTIPQDIIDRFIVLYRNKVNQEGSLVISCDAHRTQERNKQECIERLEDMLQECRFEPKKRYPTKPTRESVEKRLKVKKIVGAKKKTRHIDLEDEGIDEAEKEALQILKKAE